MLSVCLCVWMLTRASQIVTAAHRDLLSCIETYDLMISSVFCLPVLVLYLVRWD